MDRKLFEKIIDIVERHKNDIEESASITKAPLKLFSYQLKKDPMGFLEWPIYFILKPLSIRVNLNNYFQVSKFIYKRRLLRAQYILSKFSEQENKILENVLKNLDPLQKTTFLDFFNGIVVKDQYHAREFIKDGQTIIDCGANIGIFSIFASYLNENGKIYAIEPVRETTEVIKKFLGAFKVKNVKIIRNAVGNKKEKKSMYLESGIKTSGSNSLIQGWVNYDTIINVEVNTIDNIVRENNMKSVDFIKMDIEGYEKEALTGALKTIRKFKPVIAVSAYHHRDDKILLPKIIKMAGVHYGVKFVKEAEEDFIFYPSESYA